MRWRTGRRAGSSTRARPRLSPRGATPVSPIERRADPGDHRRVDDHDAGTEHDHSRKRWDAAVRRALSSRTATITAATAIRGTVARSASGPTTSTAGASLTGATAIAEPATAAMTPRDNQRRSGSSRAWRPRNGRSQGTMPDKTSSPTASITSAVRPSIGSPFANHACHSARTAARSCAAPTTTKAAPSQRRPGPETTARRPARTRSPAPPRPRATNCALRARGRR